VGDFHADDLGDGEGFLQGVSLRRVILNGQDLKAIFDGSLHHVRPKLTVAYNDQQREQNKFNESHSTFIEFLASLFFRLNGG
jgi:hypothetical protein